MANHELKTDRLVFDMSWQGLKNFEVRKNDRDFTAGDSLLLRETEYSGAEMANGRPLEYTGREIDCDVDYVLHGPLYGVKDGWVVMAVSINDIREGSE